MSEAFEAWYAEAKVRMKGWVTFNKCESAYAAGMTRAAEICDAQWKTADADECADAIRAEITKGAE